VPLRKGGRQGRDLSDEFKALWDRIKHKTTYRVQFDNDKLIRTARRAADAPHIAGPAAMAQGRDRHRQGRRRGARRRAPTP
jgi:restriction endonuclease